MPFNYTEYRRQCRSYDIFSLQKEFEKYTRMAGSGTAATSICLVLAPFTFGISLIGGVPGAASTGNAVKKLSIIEKEMNSRGHSPNLRKRDFFGGYMMGGTIGLVSHGLGGHMVDVAMHDVLSPTTYMGHHRAFETLEHVTDKVGLQGGKAIEKRAYGGVVAAQEQHDQGKYHPFRSSSEDIILTLRNKISCGTSRIQSGRILVTKMCQCMSK